MKQPILSGALTLALALGLNACSGSTESTPVTTTGDGDESTGDGDSATGDGDGTTGDGDSGDGDNGDGDNGDGDFGDGDIGDGDTSTGGNGPGDGDSGDGDTGDGDFGDGDIGDGDGDGGCPPGTYPGLEVVVKGAAISAAQFDPRPGTGGAPIAFPPPAECLAEVTAIDGEYEETLFCFGGSPEFNDCTCYGAIDRTGNYFVTARVGELEQSLEASVTYGECGVETQTLTFFEGVLLDK